MATTRIAAAAASIALIATMALTNAQAAQATDGGIASATRQQRLADRDGDGMPNAWERAHGLNPRRDDARLDPDSDQLKNLAEYRHRTRPHDPDTDAEGLRDGFEVHRTGTNPRRADTDGDGVMDGFEDGDHDGILDEGQDGDRTGFVGTVVVYDEQDRELVLELAVGYPILLALPTDVTIRMAVGCDKAPSESLLREGLDVDELYLRDGMRRGTRVIDRIVLGCPEDWL